MYLVWEPNEELRKALAIAITPSKPDCRRGFPHVES